MVVSVLLRCLTGCKFVARVSVLLGCLTGC